MKKSLLIGMLALTGCAKPPQTVVINEVAWMGTLTSPDHQWIELFNTTATPINVTGWTLRNLDGSLNVALQGTIAPYAYMLLERDTDDSVPNIAANQIYTGVLNTHADNLALLDNKNKPIDAVPSWFAGNVATHASMERMQFSAAGLTAANWMTSVYSYAGGLGTPGEVNSYFAENNVSDPLCQYPDQLEITSINIGQGDATLIATKTRLLLADAGESYWNSHRDADKIAAEIAARYGAQCKTLDYVVISHIHTDHIGYVKPEENAAGQLLNAAGGLHQPGEDLLNPEFMSGFAYLIGELGFRVNTTLLRDFQSHNPNKSPEQGGSKAFRNWRALFESPTGRTMFNPVTAQLGDDQVQLGTVNGLPVKVDVVLVDTATPAHPQGCDPATYFGGAQYLARGDRSQDLVTPSENDLSVGFVLTHGLFNAYVAGDQSGENEESTWGYRYHDTETCLAEDPLFNARYGQRMDVLRANHHGSSHSTNAAFLAALSPTVTIFSVGDHNNFGHVDKTVLTNALNTSVLLNEGSVVLTEIGAGVSSAADLCDPVNPLLCAFVTDAEFPAALESDESGDAGASIHVAHGGYQFTLLGNSQFETRTYLSK